MMPKFIIIERDHYEPLMIPTMKFASHMATYIATISIKYG